MTRGAGIVAAAEHAIKGPVWGCQMCGQCVLHSTGLTCPMTCPKTLRNGPCGGVRANGHCEVKPEMRCVWLNAYERSEELPVWRHHIDDLRPPVDNSLKGTLVVDQPGHRPRQADPGRVGGRGCPILSESSTPGSSWSPPSCR